MSSMAVTIMLAAALALVLILNHIERKRVMEMLYAKSLTDYKVNTEEIEHIPYTNPIIEQRRKIEPKGELNGD